MGRHLAPMRALGEKLGGIRGWMHHMSGMVMTGGAACAGTG